MAADFALAPPSKTVDGLLAVPIDIESITGRFVFDGGAQAASADATITYTVGPAAGNPIFDLRQTVSQAWVDGTSFPPAQLAHHTFGNGAFTDLRVLESAQAAGSVHTLRVQYPLAIPDAQLGGAYLPALEWSPGPRLQFRFGMSDLNRGRYLEAWLPANLIFDQYSLDLEVQILNTLAAHSVITNGQVTGLGVNHWQLAFPPHFSALSHLLEVRATDTLEQQTGSVTLPVTGSTVPIEVWQPSGGGVDLGAQITTIGTLLTDNENRYGGCLHEKFTALFAGSGGMEYEGGTTTSGQALEHETFHSWFARGIKPASQADGWWDEAFTKFHDDGADDAVPLDFADPPVQLCSRDPWQRHTPTTAYTEGNDFFKGMAALLGAPTLNALMRDLHNEHKGKTPVSTARIEEHLLSRSGNAQVVGGFHHFVYGLADDSPAPDLWLRDNASDTGAQASTGAFWDSPDLWVRQQDDGGTAHQSPEYGQDNWFYARVRNKAGAGTAGHFVVTFHAKGFAGTQFQYPDDYLPATAATAEFALEPGHTRIVKARWPRGAVPPPGSHTCLLAAVLSKSDLPAGKHVWESNNLAQKNLTVVDLLPNTFVIIPVVLGNWLGGEKQFDLKVRFPRGQTGLKASVVHRRKLFFDRFDIESHPLLSGLPGVRPGPPAEDLGAPTAGPPEAGRMLTSQRPELITRRFPDAWAAPFPNSDGDSDGGGGMPVEIEPHAQTVIGLKVEVTEQAEPGRALRLDLVQSERRAKTMIGGVAVQVNVPKDHR